MEFNIYEMLNICVAHIYAAGQPVTQDLGREVFS